MKDEKETKLPSEFQLEIPIVNFPKSAPKGAIHSGYFTGMSGGHSGKFYLKFYWYQFKTSDSVSTVYVDMYSWTAYQLNGNAIGGSHLTVHGWKKSFSGSISGNGDRLICQHSNTISHTTATSMNINGALIFNGTFNGTYFGTISGNSNANLIAITNPLPYVKVGGTYRRAKGVWVKVGGTYRPAKGYWVKVGGTYRMAK